MARPIRFEDLDDWEFVIDEISAGVYTMTAADHAGRSIKRSGSDPDALLADLKSEAQKVTED